MSDTQDISNSLHTVEQASVQQLSQSVQSGLETVSVFKKLRGGFLLVVGYLLSPLCWWNDLFFNLPVAYGFGSVCSLFSASLLVPGTIVGYWLSNIVGILLMQLGAGDVFQNQSKERNLKKELLTGLITSTAFTLVVLGLIQFKILDMPVLFSGS
jgi:hypothetical protein